MELYWIIVGVIGLALVIGLGSQIVQLIRGLDSLRNVSKFDMSLGELVGSIEKADCLQKSPGPPASPLPVAKPQSRPVGQWEAERSEDRMARKIAEQVKREYSEANR